MQASAHCVLPGFGLTLGVTLALPRASSSCCRWPDSSSRPSRSRWAQFWATVTSPRALAAYRLSFGAALRRGARQRRLRAARRLGARALPLPGPRRSSTRWSICPSPCPRRSPASRSRPSTPRTGGSGSTSSRSGSRSPSRRSASWWRSPSSACPSWCAPSSPCWRSSTRTSRRPPPRSGPRRWQTFTPRPLPQRAARAAHRLHAGLRPSHRRVRLRHLHLRQHAHAGRRSPRCSSSPGSSSTTTPARRPSPVVMLAVSFALLLAVNVLQRWSHRRFEARPG